MIEIRDAADRREVIGRLVTFGETIPIGAGSERFLAGAFADTDPATVRLFLEHPKSPGDKVPIGVAVELDHRSDGLYGTFRVAQTRAGDEALELIRAGVLTDLSIGFAQIESRRRGDVLEHVRAFLDHVALTIRGAIPTARVLATRADPPSELSDPVMEEPMTALDPDPVPTPDPDNGDDDNGAPAMIPEIVHRVATLEDTIRTFAASQAPAPTAPRRLDPVAWLAGEIRSLAHHDPSQRIDVRALADVTGDFPGTDAPDLSPFVIEELLGSQLVNVMATARPVYEHSGRFPMPRSGYVRVPIVTQHTLVGPRTGQKAPANSRAMQASTTSYEAQWIDGAVDVALEWIATAEAPGLALVWDDLLSQYAIATETATAAALDGAGTETGAVLPTATYNAFAEAVATQAIEVKKATGFPATALAVTEAQWIDLVGLVDTSGRRIFAPVGPTNSDGSVSFTAESFTLTGGIDVFVSYGSTSAILYNGRAFLASDGGPSRVEAFNVELMGKDVGILGRLLTIPRIPAGIRRFAPVVGRRGRASSDDE